jgi:hypothetical protein
MSKYSKVTTDVIYEMLGKIKKYWTGKRSRIN